MKEDINLLPPSAKHRRLQLLYASRVRSFLAVIVFAGLVGAAALISVWLMYMMVLNGLTERLEDGEDGPAVEQEAAEVNTFTRSFHQVVEAQTPLLPRVDELFAVLPDGVRLITMERSEKDMTLLLQGRAESTEQLLALQRRLESLEWIEQVEAPLQNFATEPRGQFSFTLFLRP